MNLVTGATGIVGMPIVVKLLQQGQTVRALHRPASQRQRVMDAVQKACPEALDRLTWCEGDVTDQASLEDALDGVGTVYHCAALVSFHPADAAAMARINADGTAHLVNAMLHCNTPRLVHVSSVAALGRKAGEPTTEDTLFEEQPGTTAYARSKHRAEMEAWRGAAEGLEGGLVVVNPTVVLGPGDFSRSSGALFRHIDHGLKWHPTGSNGFVASEDVAEVCVRLGMSDVRSRRFVLCGDQWPYQKVMDHIADALGKPRPSRPVHPWMRGLIWRVFAVAEWITGKRAVATRESIGNTGANHTYDGSRVVEVMGTLGPAWNYTPLEQAIRETAAAYRAQWGN